MEPAKKQKTAAPLTWDALPAGRGLNLTSVFPPYDPPWPARSTRRFSYPRERASREYSFPNLLMTLPAALDNRNTSHDGQAIHLGADLPPLKKTKKKSALPPPVGCPPASWGTLHLATVRGMLFRENGLRKSPPLHSKLRTDREAAAAVTWPAKSERGPDECGRPCTILDRFAHRIESPVGRRCDHV